VLAPCTPDEGRLVARRRAREGPVYAHGVGREWSDVVDDQSRVERVCREVVSGRREGKGCYLCISASAR
jgi:hypothetical protein